MKKKTFPLVAWDTIELPKKLGGLNIGNLQHKNIALLFKWVWRLLIEPNSLWAHVIKNKYSINQSFTTLDLQPLSSGGPWRFICNPIIKNDAAKFLAMNRVRKKIGKGDDTLFWSDVWVGEKPLKHICPRLFRISLSPNATVASNGF